MPWLDLHAEVEAEFEAIFTERKCLEGMGTEQWAVHERIRINERQRDWYRNTAKGRAWLARKSHKSAAKKAKQAEYRRRLRMEISGTRRCAVCQVMFSMTRMQAYMTPQPRSCSRRCAAALRFGGDANPQVKLTEQSVRRIVDRLGRIPESCIAAEFGVSVSTVACIRRGDRWSRVTGRGTR